MQPDKQEQLEQIIQRGYTHFSHQSFIGGLRIYRSHFFGFALYALIIPVVGTLLGLAGTGWVGAALMTLLVSPLLSAGYYLMADTIVQGKPLRFGRFFDWWPFTVPLLITNVLSSVILGLVMVPMYLLFEQAGLVEWYNQVLATPATPPEPPLMTSMQSTSFFLNMIPLIYLYVGFSWAYPLVLFFDTGGMRALEYSRRLVTRGWGAQFMLLLTFFSLFMVASLLLSPITAGNPGIANVLSFGLFLLLPWAHCSLYVGFRRAVDGGVEKG